VAVPWTAPDTEWTASFTKEEVRRAAAEVGRDPGDFAGVAIGKKGPSGRAVEISLGGTTVPAPEFRFALAPRRMKSTLLTSLRLEGGRVVMSGKGSGHGVGLSQHAARAMASQGQKAEDIIRFFFRGVDIKKMWP
jgi:stage II sporulation protein D